METGLIKWNIYYQGKNQNGKDFIAIPYYAWGNRGQSKMTTYFKKYFYRNIFLENFEIFFLG